MLALTHGMLAVKIWSLELSVAKALLHAGILLPSVPLTCWAGHCSLNQHFKEIKKKLSL